MKTQQFFNSDSRVVKLSFVADLSSVEVASRVASRPAISDLMRAAFISNPTGRYFLPNSIAKGNPTYPKPITPIFVPGRPRIFSPLQSLRCKAQIVGVFEGITHG